MENLILHGKPFEILLILSVFKKQFGNITLKEVTDRLNKIKK